MSAEMNSKDSVLPKKAEAISKIKYAKNGRYIFLRLSLGQLHEALGILDDVHADVLQMVRAPRIMKAQQELARRQAIRGGEGVIKGLRKNSKLIK